MDRLPPQRAIQGVGAVVTLPSGAKIGEQVVKFSHVQAGQGQKLRRPLAQR